MDRFSNLIYWAIKDRLRRSGCHFSDEDAEDIFQEFFASLWEKDKLAEIKDRNRIVGWLVMVAGNMAVDFIRKRRSHEPMSAISISRDPAYDEMGEGESIRSGEIALSSSKDSPDRIVHLNEMRQVLETTIESLPPRERTVITLSHLYGKKHREIAKLLKIPVNTVSIIVMRTRERLRKDLESKGIKDF